jgi:hypothetical protein
VRVTAEDRARWRAVLRAVIRPGVVPSNARNVCTGREHEVSDEGFYPIYLVQLVS